jgi:hypothetical protein
MADVVTIPKLFAGGQMSSNIFGYRIHYKKKLEG